MKAYRELLKARFSAYRLMRPFIIIFGIFSIIGLLMIPSDVIDEASYGLIPSVGTMLLLWIGYLLILPLVDAKSKDLEKYNRLLFLAPISRKTVVNYRFFTIALLTLASVLIGLFGGLIAILINDSFTWLALQIGTIVPLFYIGVVTSLIVGADICFSQSRYAVGAVIAIIFFGNNIFSDTIENLLSGPKWLILLSGLLIMAASYGLSLIAIERREFS